MKTPATIPSVMVLSDDGRFTTPQTLEYLVEPNGGLAVNPAGKLTLSAAGSLLAANICIGSPILVPSGNFDDIRTVGTGGRYATLAAAMADATVVAGTILKLLTNITETTTVAVNRAVVIDLAGFTVTNATSTVVFNITAPLAVVKDGTVAHTKPTNTSVETVITINVTSGVVFIMNNTIRVQEFGITLQGGAAIQDNKFQYVGASQTNSHRFIAIYRISTETKIDRNEFTCSTIPATTRYSNFVYISSTTGSSWTAPLYVSRNVQTGGSLRQFVFNDALVPTAGSKLIVAGNAFNDFNGGVGLFSAALYNGLDEITIVGNTQGGDAAGNFKGVFFVDGTGTLSDTPVLTYGGNTTAGGALRADYRSLASDTTNILARKDVVVPPTTAIEAISFDEAQSDMGFLLQDLKGRRTHIVDSNGNPIPGFGTEDQPYVIEQAESPTAEPTGFQSISSTIGFGTLIGYDTTYAFDSTATTFTLTPTPEQVVWVQGNKFVKTSPESVTVTGDGLHFIYYGADGVLAVKSTYFDLKTEASVSYVYRHDGKILFIGDERHGITMDGMTHEYLHRTRGAAYATGFGANGYTLTGTGALDSETKFNLAPGEFYDEDLLISIQHGTGGYFTQPLETPAELPVFYHDDTGWAAVQATEFPLLTTGTGRMAYNLKTGETWSVVETQNNHFAVMFVIATNNLLAPVIAVMGQADYGSKGAAEAELYSDIDLDGFPFYEFRPLYKLIYETRDAYSNTMQSVLRGVMDLRTVSSSGVGTSAAQVNDHGSLTGLLDDDHPQYLNEDRADAAYTRITFETINKNLPSSDGVAVKDPVTGLLQTITYSNGIVKTFAWTPSNDLSSITLSGSTPAGIDLVKTFTWTTSGFSFVYS